MEKAEKKSRKNGEKERPSILESFLPKPRGKVNKKLMESSLVLHVTKLSLPIMFFKLQLSSIGISINISKDLYLRYSMCDQ